MIKSIQDIGISQWPWSIDGCGENNNLPKVRDKNGNEIAQPLSTLGDAKMIADSPWLYHYLEEAVYDVCGHCSSGGIEHRHYKLESGESYDDKRIADCRCNYGTCHIQRWRRTLEGIANAQSVKYNGENN